MADIGAAEHAEILVVGSGAAGSVIAATAAEGGRDVLILEAGPERGLDDLTSSQIWARRLKWPAPAVRETGTLPVGHAFNAGWGTGGGALHHYAVWPRLKEVDFNTHSQFGYGLDWPLSYADLAPWYDRVQAEVGVSGDAELEIWRPPGEPYPMPPLPVFDQGRVIARGFSDMGMTTAPLPLAINSRPWRQRSGCLYDGWCDAGCPIGALANPLVTYLPRARAAGARLRHQACVTRIRHDSSGSRVTGVDYIDAGGETRTVRADTVVLAAFVVQNARLLLASASDKHPAGLSNRNDLVGRYLMTHPANYIYGLFEDATNPHLGPTGGQLICHDRYQSERNGGGGSYQWLIANAVKPNDLAGVANTRPDIIGPALAPFLKRAARHFGTMVCVAEDIPRAENRIVLDRQKDRFGVPLAHAHHDLDSMSAALVKRGIEEGLSVFRAAGAGEAWSGATFGMHHMGGTVMGTDSARSVTDPLGRCHELENLYIAGPGLFPTSGAVNPTFTVHALALRTGQHLAEA